MDHCTCSFFQHVVLGVAVIQILPELNKGKEDPKVVAVEEKFPSLVLKDYK